MSAEKIEIVMPNGAHISCATDTTIKEALAIWDKKVLASTIAARVNGSIVDLSMPLREPVNLSLINTSSAEGLRILRHSIAHVMAQAVQELFHNVQIAIGPAIEDGFYYDFDYDASFTPEDLEKIEGKMQKIIAENLPFQRQDISREAACSLFQQRGEIYKVELINDLPPDVDMVSIYSQGSYMDLCRGPHIPSSGMIKAFKLLNVAGAYWRGSEHNKMLQRIYGTGFADQKSLKEHLSLLEEAKKRDHRRLGRELELFQVNEEAGAGLIIYHPKGALLRGLIEDWEKKEHRKRGYDLVMGPQILKVDLWKKSGHFDHYRQNMYFTEVEEQTYGIKPMNCLAHMLIYKSKTRSYRDLPLRFFELGTVLRHEKTGVLHGLLRVRQFTQDDAHILCMPEQLDSEIKAVVDFIDYAMEVFGFEYEVELSTRPEQSIGSDQDWDMAESALQKALTDKGLNYEINAGDGAFYGPKIDFKLKDALKRKWQCATIQCDFTLPERFELSYIGIDGEKHRPVMLHRVILGAIERFMGVLIEHYAGAFPVWLSPVQAVIVTVTDRHIPYSEEVYAELQEAGIRVEKDFRNEKLGYKIREAQVQKIPYMLVMGDREVEAAKVSPRQRDGNNLDSMSVNEFIALITEKCRQHQ